MLHSQELDKLASLGFPTNPLNKRVQGIDKVWEEKIDLESKRKDLNYPIDGLVVKINDNELLQELGVVGKTNRGWCAIKFAATESATLLIGITWQVGRTGKVIPVAELEPVLLDGTTVKRATLHNAKQIQNLDININDTVVVRKAGDIIPEVIKSLPNFRTPKTKPVVLPFNCPKCSTELIYSDTGIDLYCPNTQSCPAQVLGRLSYFASRKIGNIVGLSDKIIQKFIELYDIKDIPDLYKLPFSQIMEIEGFGKKSVQNLESAIEKSKNMKVEIFLAGLALEGIGPEVAKLIVNKVLEKTE